MTHGTRTTDGFQIFRAADAPGMMEAGCMTIQPFSPEQSEGMSRLMQAGLPEGEQLRVLCNIPGFSLTHVWFKAGFPLPLHSHDADCLYYIVAGSARLGTEELGPRDSFFVPKDVPYTYKPGPNGVEILEFRHEAHFNFVNLSKGAGFYDRAEKTVIDNVEAWKAAPMPALTGSS